MIAAFYSGGTLGYRGAACIFKATTGSDTPNSPQFSPEETVPGVACPATQRPPASELATALCSQRRDLSTGPHSSSAWFLEQPRVSPQVLASLQLLI